MPVRRRGFIKGGLAAAALSLWPRGSAAEPGAAPVAADRRVFGYYFLAHCTRGFAIPDFERDFADAQKAGLDGFAVAAGAWSTEADVYVERATKLFQAARNVKSPLKLFISAEVGGPLSPADVRDMLLRFKDHPNYLWRSGKPVLVTSGGEYGSGSTDAEGEAFWRAVFSDGLEAFFVPAFLTQRAATSGLINSSNPSYADLVAAYERAGWWNELLDGMSYQALSGTPQWLIESSEAYARICRIKGKLQIAGLNPYYAQTKRAGEVAMLFAFEGYGGEGLEQQWTSIREVQRSEWVMVWTWCDLGESFLTPADPSELAFNNLPPGEEVYAPMHSHAGFTRLNEYYIRWFKDGEPPPITQDGLFWCYRTHPKDLVVAGNTQSVHTFELIDAIFLTGLLTAPATLRVTTGGNVHEIAMDAGRTHVRVPFSVGPQSIELIRDGRVLIHETPQHIYAFADAYDFAPTTGFATTR